MVAQFLNVEAGDMSSLGSGGLALHKRTATRDEHTTQGPRAGTPAVHLVDEVEGTRAALAFIADDRRRRAGRRGRPPGGTYNFLFTGPARYDGSNGNPLSEEQELAWARQCVEWVQERAPDAIVAAAVLHRDEAAPHVHLTLVPRYQPSLGPGKEREPARIDWRAVRAQLAGRPVRGKLKTAGLSKREVSKLRAADKKEAQADMVALLDAFHADVSEPFGIARAVTGEGKRRRAVDRRVAAELEATAAEAQRERAERAQREAKAEAAKAEERARAAAAEEEAAREAAAELGPQVATLRTEKAGLEAEAATLRDELEAGRGGGLRRRSERGRGLKAEAKAKGEEAEAARQAAEKARQGHQQAYDAWKAESQAREGLATKLEESETAREGLVQKIETTRRGAHADGEARVWACFEKAAEALPGPLGAFAVRFVAGVRAWADRGGYPEELDDMPAAKEAAAAARAELAATPAPPVQQYDNNRGMDL